MTNENILSDIETNFKTQLKRDKAYYVIQTKQNQCTDLTIENYCQCISLNMHDFFFIPDQSNYAVGQNEIILEISTRSNLNNRIQPLNNKHEIIQPKSIKYEHNKYEEQQLSTPNFYMYDVQRLIIEANESIEIIRLTMNRFHLCILVEGDAIEIEYNSIDNNQEKQIRKYNTLETFLIPASIHQYRLRPRIQIPNKINKSHQYILLIIFLK
jgi:hypothetical protein